MKRKRNETQIKETQVFSEAILMTKHLASPSILILTVVYIALLVGGGSQMKIAFKTAHDPAAAGYVAADTMAIKLASFLALVSALVLGVFVAPSGGRVRFVGSRTAEVQIAALGGAGV